MTADAAARILTIGHSTRTLAEFTDLLEWNGVGHVVDVRRLPGSARYPHFDHEALGAALADLDIALTRSEPLTGRRPVSTTVPFEVNAWWDNRSFHNYADHALSDEFRDALAALRAAAGARPTAVMCSEAVWWRCHRRIIADHLIAAGEPVGHIMAPGKVVPAVLSAGAVPDAGRVTYPRPPAEEVRDRRSGQAGRRARRVIGEDPRV